MASDSDSGDYEFIIKCVTDEEMYNQCMTHQLTKERLYTILENLDDRTLLNFCQFNKKSHNICMHEPLWETRYHRRIGISYKPMHMTWRKYYLTELSRR